LSFQQQVGDTIKVLFMNNGTNPYTMHPHGVQYDKANEGAWYKYGTSKGDNVQPGEAYEYTVSISHKLTCIDA
jgi:manganese oxidase